MLFAAAAIALLSVGLVSAEEHFVDVGGPGKLLYSPEAIFAAPGDVVHFRFLQKNHTATQSSFAAPCSPLMGDNGAPMFDSGFHFVADTQTDGFNVVDYVVKDTKPTWMFCQQTGHCGKGMVFAINCGADGAPNSFTNFKASALAIGAAAASAPPAPLTTAGGVTVYPDPPAPTVTATISLTDGSQWTTTYASYPGSPDPTPSTAAGIVYQVKVGGAGLTYDPPSLQGVKPRDRVQFIFQNKNHTVTQSTFQTPCSPMQSGFDSGFQFVAANTAADQLPMWELTVQTTAPIWAYCKQANHCASGMVFAINSVESSDKNFAAFSTIAKNSATVGQAANAPGSTNPYGSGAGTLIASTLFASVGAFMAFFL
jgi:plastocyanin